MASIYHIETDIQCIVLHYGKEICIATPGEASILELRKGRHKLTFISTENASDMYSILFEVPDNDIEDFLEVSLSPIRRHRILERVRKEHLKREEVERARREQIAAVEEEKRRIEGEIEQKRLEEEFQCKRKLQEDRLWKERELLYQRYLDLNKDLEQYVIQNAPIIKDNIEYYVGNEKYSPVKTVGARSKVFLASKRIKRMIRFDERDLIDFFASVGGKVFKDHLSPFYLELDSKTRDIIRNSKYCHLFHEDKEHFTRRIKSIMKDSLPNVSDICQMYYYSRQIIDGRDYLKYKERNNYLTLNEHSLLNFFCYEIMKNESWMDFYYKYYEHTKFEETDFPFEEEVKILKQSDLQFESFVEECIEYRKVVIDEACNELFDATGRGHCILSSNGVFAFVKQKEGNGKISFSLCDFHGREILTFEKDLGVGFDRFLLRGSSLSFSPSGFLFLDTRLRSTKVKFHVLWISGAICVVNSYDRMQKIHGGSFVFKNKERAVNNLPEKNYVFLIDRKFFLNTYQGLLEIEKPTDWKEG